MRIPELRILGLTGFVVLLATASPAFAFGDCPLVGTIENFEASQPPRTINFDAEPFHIVEGGAGKTVEKRGKVCQQDYALKDGMPAMSALEIMQKYAEGLPSLGMRITNTDRSADDEVFATVKKGSLEYWIRVSESNGNGLHVMVLQVTPFQGRTVAAGPLDCPLVPVQQNFTTAEKPRLFTYDAEEFLVVEGDEQKNVRKTGRVCKQDYELKPGVAPMSALEIMQTYAEALPAAGMKITNSRRNADDEVFATVVKDGVSWWVRVAESNGNGLHILVLQETPFRAALAPPRPEDCPIIPVQQSFQLTGQPYLRTYDVEDIRVTDGDTDKEVKKYGRICHRDYELKPGVAPMSALEIMRNYVEAAASTGYEVTNTHRNPDDEVFATMTRDGATYWFRISESNGNGLHITTLQEAPFQSTLAALTAKDCPLAPALQSFEASNPPRFKKFDAMDFQVVEGDQTKPVSKKGKVCQQDYELKAGNAPMSALEIMRNYVEAAASTGYEVTNTHRIPDDEVFATMTRDGATYWFRISESNGNGLHITTLQEAPFRSTLAALTAKDCPLAPTLEAFEASNPPRFKKFDAMDFQVVEGDQTRTVTKKGKVCQQDYELKAGNAPMSALELMRNYAEGLPAEGLTITNSRRNPDEDVYATMTKDGVESWVRISESNGNGLHTAVLQIEPFHSTMKAPQPAEETPAPAPAPAPKPAAAEVTLPPPAAAPEAIDPMKGDFPYLPPVAGSKLTGGKALSEPFFVQPRDAKEPEIVAQGSIVKSYAAPAGLTPIQILDLYRAAFLKGQWSIVSVRREGDVGLSGHYGLNGRNIWATLHIGGASYDIAVADATVGEAKLEANLGSKCHLALTGVLFDFNKSKLKPESDAVLNEVAAVMAKVPALRLEVQGHTDGIGSEEYNLPLSKARAHSVVVWLTDHGVGPDRLDARGYGKTRPVASNDIDEGRAQNRRVEIANPACKTANP